MGNQQERLIWLAGFLDGEGYFGALNRPNNRSRSHKFGAHGIQIVPRVILTNVSTRALAVVEQIMEEHNLAYYIQWREPGKQKRTMWQWHMEITGIKRLKRFLEVILPYLVVKQPQAQALYEFCKSRLERYDGKPNLTLYSGEDIALSDRLKELNQNPQRLHAEPLKRGRYSPSTSES